MISFLGFATQFKVLHGRITNHAHRTWFDEAPSKAAKSSVSDSPMQLPIHINPSAQFDEAAAQASDWKSISSFVHDRPSNIGSNYMGPYPGK